MVEINWLAVIVGTIGYQALGAIWYGPVFGSRWMDSMGIDPHDHEGEGLATGVATTTVGSLVAVVALAIFIDWVSAGTWEMGLLVGLIAGVGFVATSALQAVPFEGRPWPVYLLGVGYNVVALAGAGVLLVVL